MMYDEESESLTIKDRRSSITLTRCGDGHDIDMDTLITAKTHNFSGEICDYVGYGVVPFHDELSNLRDFLMGSAVLEGLENLRLTMTAKRLGAISVDVTLVESYEPKVALNVGIEIDQTYLDGILRKLEQLYPEHFAKRVR